MYIVALLMTSDVSLYFFDCVLCRFCHCLEREGLVEAFLSSRFAVVSSVVKVRSGMDLVGCHLIHVC
jgi:hypothetical protein